MSLSTIPTELGASSNYDRTVMTGLVPVIHVVNPPEKLRISRKRSRVDGRDEPGHDGNGGSNSLSFDISRSRK
jgi:hypothetical protein